jgi:hypothetical protein
MFGNVALDGLVDIRHRNASFSSNLTGLLSFGLPFLLQFAGETS